MTGTTVITPFSALRRATCLALCALVLTACSRGGGGGGGGGGLIANGTNSEVVIETSRGIIRFALDAYTDPDTGQNLAPETANAMAALVLSGEYDNKTFFDVRPGKFVQFGDPDPALAKIDPVQVEITSEPLDVGTVALGWVGSKGNSTHRLIFPLTRLDTALDSQFTVFGKILEGQSVLSQVQPGDSILRISARLFRPIIRLVTKYGSIVIEMDPTIAPNHVGRVSDLTCQGFYNGLTFHRVESTLVQTGDPTGAGDGGSGTTIPAEINSGRFFRTAVGMARLPGDLDSADSQFFIMKAQVRELDGQYTRFAKVIAGMEAVDQIQVGDVVQNATLQFDLDGRDCTGTAEPPPDGSGFTGGGTIS